MFITEPWVSNGLDAFLLVGLGVYALGLLLQTGMATMILVLGALLGPTWTMLKALMQARQLEAELEGVRTNCVKWTQRDDLPKITGLPWKSDTCSKFFPSFLKRLFGSPSTVVHGKAFLMDSPAGQGRGTQATRS